MSLCRATPRNVFIGFVWIVIIANVIFFLCRTLSSSNRCDVESVLQQQAAKIKSRASKVQDKKDGNVDTAAATGENGDEFEGCEKVNVVNSSAAGQQRTWCMYKDEVDLRIIVLTYNRHESLLKLLRLVKTVTTMRIQWRLLAVF